jgi:hypothetical protein
MTIDFWNKKKVSTQDLCKKDYFVQWDREPQFLKYAEQRKEDDREERRDRQRQQLQAPEAAPPKREVISSTKRWRWCENNSTSTFE